MKINIITFRNPGDLESIPATASVLGIEVPPTTAQEVLERCNLGNIDPQHTEGKSHCAASEVLAALQSPGSNPVVEGFLSLVETVTPEDEVWLITPRLDLDAAAAMALLLQGRQDRYAAVFGRSVIDYFDSNLVARIDAVNIADSFSVGKMPWPGQRPFPTPEEPWLQLGGAGEVREIGAANWLCGWTFLGPKLALAPVVEAIGHWLVHGEPEACELDDPAGEALLAAEAGDHITMLQAARMDAHRSRVIMAQAFKTGQLTMPEIICEGRAVFFDLTESRLPTSSTAGLGYCLAPVSTIQLFDSRAKMVRFSVASFNHQYFDYDNFVNAANKLEAEKVAQLNALDGGSRVPGKWGGNRASCMIGSPQDNTTPTLISRDEFKALVCDAVKQ